MIFTDVKEAIYDMVLEMTKDNDFNYDWYPKKDKRAIIPHPEECYCQVLTVSEENTDSGNFTGTTKYRNNRDIEFHVYIKSAIAKDGMEQVVEDSQDALELGLDDLKTKFNSVYNALGDEGILACMYKAMRFETLEDSGILSPVKMIVTFNLQYIEDRRL